MFCIAYRAAIASAKAAAATSTWVKRAGGISPAQLARGISVALYNTGFGILIAVPALIFHRHFRTRVDDYMHEMEHAAARLLRVIAARAEPAR